MLGRMSRTVHDLFQEAVKKSGDRPAHRVKRDGTWQTITWKRYADDVRRAAKALIALGVQPKQGVAILGQGTPEWLVADVGAIFAGAMPAGIYPTSTPEQVEYITHHAEARVAFAVDAAQAKKFLSRRDGLPHLVHVVQMVGAPEDVGVLSWEAFLARGEGVPDARLDERLAAQKATDVCTLIYTSGTTGQPKAVMITHGNIVFVADQLVDIMKFTADEVGLAYLPLNHIAEQMLSIHGPMAMGSCIYFAESLEKLGENLKEARPTYFVGAPRVWEKIQAKMAAAGKDASPVRKKLVAWARKTGLRAGYAEQSGARKPTLTPVAQRLVFSKVRERLGLDRARVCVTSTAPIARDTLDFFLSLGIPLLEVYGMSECTGPTTLSMPDRYRTGTVGVPIPGTELKTAEDGEILMRGPHVFAGYLKDAEATREALDADGWLHSGDVGTVDADGFVRITDRKKELLITAGGENVAPQLIESLLKGIPAVSQAVVVGDRRKYLAALLTLDPERVAQEAEAAGSPARSVADAATCAAFQAYVEKQVEGVNQKLARVQTVKKVALLPRELSMEEGELTPTMKVRRKVVNERFAREIEGLFG